MALRACPSPYVFFLSKKGLCILLLTLAEESRVDTGDAHDSASLRQSRRHPLQKRQGHIRRGNPINVHCSRAAFQLVEEITVSRFGNVDKASGSRCRIDGIRVDGYSGRFTANNFL